MLFSSFFAKIAEKIAFILKEGHAATHEDKLNQAHSNREDYSVGQFVRISRGEFVISHELGIEQQ